MYIDDTITYMEPDLLTNVTDILNKFNQCVKFIYEIDKTQVT